MKKVFSLSFSLLAFFFLGPSYETNAQSLPDLMVTKIKCASPEGNLFIEIMNKSNVPLPKGRRSIADVYIDGIKRGFFDLGKPTKERPASSVTFTWGPGTNHPTIGIGPHSIKVVIVDIGDVVQESNEANNSRTENLFCRRGNKR